MEWRKRARKESLLVSAALVSLAWAMANGGFAQTDTCPWDRAESVTATVTAASVELSGSLPLGGWSWVAYSVAASGYENPAPGVFEQVAEGLRVFGTGYRSGAVLHTSEATNPQGRTLHLKWKVHGAGDFSAMFPGLLFAPQWSDDQFVRLSRPGGFTTRNVYNDSVLIADDTWYYTRVVFGSSDATIRTARGAYDDAGGIVVDSLAVTFQASLTTARLVLVWGDNYSGVNAYFILGEATAAGGQAPIANFAWSPQSLIVGQSVQFTDTSAGSPTAWSWSFGDGATSTQRNPTHTYSSPGTMTVTLAVSNAYGSTNTSHAITVAIAGQGDLELHDFTLNHGQAFSGTTWVPCEVNLRGAGSGWPGGDVEIRVYFVDIKGVGHDTRAGWGWGDNNRLVRNHHELDLWVPPLAPGQGYAPLPIMKVAAFAADYTDAVRVELVNGDGSLINGLQKSLEKSVSIPFNVAEGTWNCVGSVLTAVAPVLGGGNCLKSNWINDVKDFYDGTKMGWFFGARVADIYNRNFYNAGLKTTEAALKHALGLTAAAIGNCLPLASLVTAGLNEISPFWGGSGGCGTLAVHGALALFTKGSVAAANALGSPGSPSGVRALSTGNSNTITAFSYEGSATLTVRDASSRLTTIANSGTWDTGIPGSSCFASPDFLIIAVPTELGPFSLSGTAAATGQVSVRVLTPSFGAGATAVGISGGGTTTEQYTWTLSAQSGDTFAAQTQAAGVSQLQLTRGGQTTPLNAQQEHVDPTPLLFASPTRPGTYTYLVPSSAHNPGLNGTNWVTDLVIHNPGSTYANVGIVLLASGSDNSGATGPILSLGSNGSLPLGDVVQRTLGLGDQKGALWISSDQPLMVTSRTFNNAASGTYGQYFPGLPTQDAIGGDQEARLIQLTKNANFRTNIGLANVTANSLEVWVGLYRADGSFLRERSYTLPPFGFFQETNIIGLLTSANVDDAYAAVRSRTAGGKFFAYASVIDNRTGDPIAVMPPTMTWGVIYVPAAAHLSGFGGTNWRTDLELHNPGALHADYTIALLKRDQANSTPATRSYSLGPGQSVRYDDVLQRMFSASGAATLRITPTSGHVFATSRSYNDQPAGTYGQFVGGQADAAAILYGQTPRLVQLSQSASDVTGFRTNVGVVNATNATISVVANLYRGDGTSLGAKTYSLGPYECQQADKVFRSVVADEVTDGFAVLSTTTAGGRFFAYASVIDNRSGDPIYIPARVPTAGACTAPSITVPPANQTVTSGQTATLSVVATGAPPLRYQWYQGSLGDTSSPVGLDSATFTTPAVTSTTSYWVRVSNACGHADSATGTITVAPSGSTTWQVSLECVGQNLWVSGSIAIPAVGGSFDQVVKQSSSPVSATIEISGTYDAISGAFAGLVTITFTDGSGDVRKDGFTATAANGDTGWTQTTMQSCTSTLYPYTCHQQSPCPLAIRLTRS